MERRDRWTGNARQTANLGAVLQLTPRELLTVTGRNERLTALLREAVSTRWQAYVRPVAKTVPLDRHLLEDALQALHQDYQGQMVASQYPSRRLAAT